MPDHRLTRLDRWWIRRHQRHGHVTISTAISIPAFDPSARGVLIMCDCGTVRAR